MKLLAHIADRQGIREDQLLADHCRQTAEYASSSVEGTGFQNLCFAAGLIHDMGKAKQELVDYLEAAYRKEPMKKGSVIHTFAGVIYLLEKYHAAGRTGLEKLTSEMIGYAVGAHHGLFDCEDPDGRNGFEYRLEKNRSDLHYEETLSNFFSQVASQEEVDRCFGKAVKEVQAFWSEALRTYQRDSSKTFFQASMLTRLILSAVIYGDRRDTGEFMSGVKNSETPEADWAEYERCFESRIADFRPDSELNRVRSDISGQCRAFAERPGGIYRLNVPTGGGKTLASLRYALAHAGKYHKKRIIFIIPLLSVLDQNVKVIRDYVPYPEKVLEHHSNVVKEHLQKEELDRFEFLTDSWNAPIVVSTLVQFLNILFAPQPSAVGRMQALCGSVIVIDEVQSLPGKMTVIFNMALNFLQQFCGATIVLSSATQPCFDELKWPLHLAENPDMVRLDEQQMRVFERAGITDCTTPYGMDFEEFAEFCEERMEENASLLVICNTKAEARRLYERLLQQISDQEKLAICHLSAAMCQKHRWNMLKDVQDELSLIQEESRNGKRLHRLICVSTQLIEAGIDVSFQCAVRVLAGIDNLAQTAGRCNRSNEYGSQGRVYLVNLKNENLSMLRDIASAQNSTRRVLEIMKHSSGSFSLDEEITRKFYRFLYEETQREIRYPVKDEKGHIRFTLTDLLSNQNFDRTKDTDYLLHQPFKTAGQEFRVFDQNTTDVLVPYKDGIRLADEFRNLQKKPYETDAYRKILREAKQYTVSIYDWQKKKLEDAGLLTPAMDGRIWILDGQAYDDQCGLTVLEEQPVGNFIL